MASEERCDNTVPLGMLLLWSLTKIKGHYCLPFWRRVGEHIAFHVLSLRAKNIRRLHSFWSLPVFFVEKGVSTLRDVCSSPSKSFLSLVWAQALERKSLMLPFEMPALDSGGDTMDVPRLCVFPPVSSHLPCFTFPLAPDPSQPLPYHMTDVCIMLLVYPSPQLEWGSQRIGSFALGALRSSSENTAWR